MFDIIVNRKSRENDKTEYQTILECESNMKSTRDMLYESIRKAEDAIKFMDMAISLVEKERHELEKSW